jgi:hypothetical protein
MKLTREELLRQKALVEQQLEWIDLKLRQLDSGIPPDQPPPPPKQHPVPVPPEKTRTPPPPGEIATPSVSAVDEAQDLDFTPNTSTAGVKIGCILTGVLASALALFLLFGLPYLLD